MSINLTTQQNTEIPITQENSASEPLSTQPEAPEATQNPSTPEVVNNTTPETTENKGKMAESGQNTGNTLENRASASEPLETKPETSEIPENPINPSSEPVSTGTAFSDAKTLADKQIPEERTAQMPVNEPLIKTSLARELLIKARNAIQFRKRKKLDKIMALFLRKQKITNKDVGDFLHVSDATATRYLDILEKENKIKQVGKTGHAVSYSKL